jgi:hypothetical protein
MSRCYRRFELLLPLRFNDGTPVPGNLITETVEEIENQFGAVTSETQIIRGHWHHEGRAYREDFFRLFVDVPDIPENKEFFTKLKERVKERFNQIDVWVTTFPVEAL